MDIFADIGGMLVVDDLLNFGNDPFMTIITFIMIGVIGTLACGIFYLIDSSFRKKFTTSGIIVQKGFTPAHTTVVLQQVGKVSVPQTIHHPDRWSFLVELGGAIDAETDEVDVSVDVYDKLNIGDHVSVRAVTGRLSGSTYITSVIGY